MARVEGEDRNRSPDERQADRGEAERRPAGEGAFGNPSTHDEEMVRQRAYELYQRRGGSHGSDMEDWLAAEREVRGEGGGRGGETRGDESARAAGGDVGAGLEREQRAGGREAAAEGGMMDDRPRETGNGAPGGRRSASPRKAPARKQRPPRGD